MKTAITFIFFFISTQLLANTCKEFEEGLEKSLARNAGNGTLSQEGNRLSLISSTESVTKKYKNWSSKASTDYKIKYETDQLHQNENRRFINLIEKDADSRSKKVIYLDVENAAQKKLNDLIIGDKGMVDAVNNSFFQKLIKNLKNDPELMDRFTGNYKDYKSRRFRFKLRESDNESYFQNKINEIYKKSNDEFIAEFKAANLHLEIPPIADDSTDISTWFLAGMDESPLLANMAARKAREMGFGNGSSRALTFKEATGSYFTDVMEMENLRKKLSSSESLIKSGVISPTPEGMLIPSKEMIKILRKYKPNDSTDMLEYSKNMQARVKKIFGVDISDIEVEDFTKYFKKIDSVSPPLFVRNSQKIDLGEAQAGIVSVDFAGVGVDNAYEQMRALAIVDYNKMLGSKIDKGELLKNVFSVIQKNVDGVTEDMNKAKRLFSSAISDPNDASLRPLFSGDDGIFMPKNAFGKNEKAELINKLVKTGEPSKFRVTFVRTRYSNGRVIPALVRSSRIVRAEEIEKKIREASIALEKISPERASKMIFAVDSIPFLKGGKFNLIIGGEKPTEAEKKILLDAFSRTLSSAEGEVLGELIEVIK